MLNSLVTGQAPQVAKNKEQLVRSNMKQSSIIRLLAGNTELPRSELFITICSIHSSTQKAGGRAQLPIEFATNKRTGTEREICRQSRPQEIWMVSPSLGAISAHHRAQLPFTIPGCHECTPQSTTQLPLSSQLPSSHWCTTPLDNIKPASCDAPQHSLE
jgi:hypothetical protein